MRNLVGVFAALAALAAGTSFAEAAVTVQGAQGRCTGLAGLAIGADAFDLPTGGASITEAVLVRADAGTGLPEYCRVRGSIAPADPADMAILFQVNLPTEWNAKTVQYGGGGLNGVVIEATGPFAGGGGPVRPALARGYVTYGSDSGHQGTDRAFIANRQAWANYSHEAVKRSFDVMGALVMRYYGRAPQRNYHIGGSKGGHEALQAAQRYYADFDGVVSYYPAARTQSLSLGWNRMWHYAFNVPGGALNRAEQTLLHNAVMRACDRLDGAADGIVSNMAACGRRFRVETLRCPQGRDGGDVCLSDPQIAALNAAAQPLRFPHPMPNGVMSVGPWPVFNGADLDLWFGDGTDGSQQGFFRSTALRPEVFDGASVSAADWQANVLRLAEVFDASNPNIDGFRGRGGRMILVQGTTDTLVPYSLTDDYFNALQRRYGAGLRDFARYYVVPGYGHGWGAFVSRWDALEALDTWVETGQAPQNPVASDGNRGRNRTRPLCEHPTWPRYSGRRSMDEARNFTCVAR